MRLSRIAEVVGLGSIALGAFLVEPALGFFVSGAFLILIAHFLGRR